MCYAVVKVANLEVFLYNIPNIPNHMKYMRFGCRRRHRGRQGQQEGEDQGGT